MQRLVPIFSLAFCLLFLPPVLADSARFQFWQMTRFDQASCRWASGTKQTTVTTPIVFAATPWNEMIASWNVGSAPQAPMEVFARAWSDGRATGWYSLGRWAAPGGRRALRTSRVGQRDRDGEVKTDTLVLTHAARRFQLRVVMARPIPLRFLGVSLTNTHAPITERSPNRLAWGHELPVPAFSQLAYPDGEGWCSPSSLAMVLTYWAHQAHRPDWSRTVPRCAAGVYDTARDGTGNWSFNVAYAGSLPGLRARVTRLPDTRALEDLVAQGVPVILAVSVNLRRPDEQPGPSGHLIVCVGFMADGDLIVHDPWTHRERGETVRRVVPRDRLRLLWAKSDHTAYLIHPQSFPISQEILVP